MTKQFSDKKTAKALVDLCVEGGIREVVLSPGSRNAPLIFSFSACDEIKTFTVVDERSAAFFALGMAQQLGRPVGLVCTSGTAALNYAPAIAEAYYQQIPLVVITADRPQEWIDQADGQTIRQDKVYANFIKYSCTLPAEIHFHEDEWQLNRFVSDALFFCMHQSNGPVHINVPLTEPLYGRTVYNTPKLKLYTRCKVESQVITNQLQEIIKKYDSSKSVMILVGLQKPNVELSRILNVLAEEKNVLVLSETTSNLNNKNFIVCIDRVLASIDSEDQHALAPDLLITFDGQVTSKNIKVLLRKNKPQEHWHISLSPNAPDTYRALTASIEMTPVSFLEAISKEGKPKGKGYIDFWLMQNKLASQKHNRFVDQLIWSDLRFFSLLKNFIPQGYILQIANSTPIRYVQLFEEYSKFSCFSNRGTNGIDGCTSTAVGAAFVSDKPTLFITGDLSFFYDSNALWNNYLRPDLKIIVINNGGGGIFRHISGPMDNEEMESYFEVKQNISCELLVKCFGLDYHCCENEAEVLTKLPDFFSKNDNAQVLEIKTPRLENAEILKEYFNHLK